MDVTHLQRHALFSSLNPKQREFVARHADEVSLPAGQVIVSSGHAAWEFFLIEEGSAEVRHGADKVRDLGPGDYLGDIGVMATDTRGTSSVFTTSPVRLIVMASHELRVIANQMPKVADMLRRTVVERTSA